MANCPGPGLDLALRFNFVTELIELLRRGNTVGCDKKVEDDAAYPSGKSRQRLGDKCSNLRFVVGVAPGNRLRNQGNGARINRHVTTTNIMPPEAA
jgi:hypothetical protein